MGTKIGCPGCSTPLAVPRSGFSPGTLIAGFEIVRPLGKGGMGEVYLARQLSMGREIALKVLSAEFAAIPGAVERFVKEVHVAAKLEHAHIVAAYDAGQDDGLHYMAMSFIPGQSLNAMLKPGVVLAERDALTMTRQLAQALDYAWCAFRIIHRDIKPANILFDAKGEPKLADMGLSKSLDDADALTMSGSVMGTPNYMSPEQAEGAGDLDLRADIYSLGATLYHAVTGEMPFAGSSIMAVLRKQAVEILPDPRQFNPQLSEHFVGLLQIMLAKSRDDRYADWKALIHDIDFVLDSRPPSVALPGEGKSVLIRKGAGHGPQKKIVIPKEGIHPHPAPAPAPRPKPAMKPRDKALVFGGAVVLGLAALATILAVSHSNQRAEQRKLQAQSEAQIQAQKSAESLAREAQAAKNREQAELWQVAADFAAANTGEFDRAIANFEDAGTRLAGTKYELMAKNEIERVRAARAEALAKALADLSGRAKELADRKDFAAAAEVFARYQGAFAGDLVRQRTVEEQKYRTLAAEAAEMLSQAERDAKTREQAVIVAAAESIYAGDPATARQACGALLDDPAVTIDKSAVKRISGWIEAAMGADAALLATFEAQKRKEIVLTSGAAKIPVRVTGVRGDRVLIEQRKGVGWASTELTVAQIPLEERQLRMAGQLDPAALGLWNGMAYIRGRRPDLAAESFKSTGELATLLLAKTEGAKSGDREAAAQSAFAQVMLAAGLPAVGLQPAAITERLQPGKITVAQASAALRQLDAYAAAFGDTQFVKSAADTLAMLRPALEAAKKGVILAAPAPVQKLDEFTKLVLAARVHTGEVVRCSPTGGNGVPSYDEAVKHLKPGTILRLIEGSYRKRTINVRRITLETEGEVAADITILADGCVMRGVRVPKFLLRIAAHADSPISFLVVDSNPGQVDVSTHNFLYGFNSMITLTKLGAGARAQFRHCTFMKSNLPGLILLAGDARQLIIEDCLLAADDRLPVQLQMPDLTTKPEIVVECVRSVMYSKDGLGTREWGRERTQTQFAETGDDRIFRFSECVTKAPEIVRHGAGGGSYALAANSPGKGIAAGGRDPGALLDAQGNILPLDPVPPTTGPGIAPKPPASVPPARVAPGAEAAPKDMVLIPAGSFQMGDTFGEGHTRELPVHKVSVSAFYMDKYEVTKALWDEVYMWAVSHGYDFENGGRGKAANHPVHNVDWYDIAKWCNARSEKEGLPPCYTVAGSIYRTGQSDPDCNWSANGYRLPTEAEWEKAARGGAEGRRFPWADSDTITHGRANYTSSNGCAYDVSSTPGFHPTYAAGEKPFTSPVGSFPANGYGLYDMAGNVCEWCWDRNHGYASESQTDPTGPTTGSARLVRGSSWNYYATSCRTAFRDAIGPSHRANYLGFRSVRPLGRQGERDAEPGPAVRSVPAVSPVPVASGAKTAFKDMVLIPAGEFQMGDTFGEGKPDELPVHTVSCSAFHIDKYEVTKKLFDDVYEWALKRPADSRYAFDNRGEGKEAKYPVHTVNWYDCVKWCNARSEKEGLTPCYTINGAVYRTGQNEPNCNWSANGYRLPTEAEWEKAARGGAVGHRFPWADTDTITHKLANYTSTNDCSYDTSSTRGRHPKYASGILPTSPVGSFDANGYGLFDMAGNVREWCGDFHSSSYNKISQEPDPRGTTTGSHRVLRGGSWYNSAWYCRTAYRDHYSPTNRDRDLGFRSVRAPGQ